MPVFELSCLKPHDLFHEYNLETLRGFLDHESSHSHHFSFLLFLKYLWYVVVMEV